MCVLTAVSWCETESSERWGCPCGGSFLLLLSSCLWHSRWRATSLHSSLITGCSPVHPSKITFSISAFGVPAFKSTSIFTRRMDLRTMAVMICILTCMRTSGTGSYLVRWLCIFSSCLFHNIHMMHWRHYIQLLCVVSISGRHVVGHSMFCNRRVIISVIIKLKLYNDNIFVAITSGVDRVRRLPDVDLQLYIDILKLVSINNSPYEIPRTHRWHWQHDHRKLLAYDVTVILCIVYSV